VVCGFFAFVLWKNLKMWIKQEIAVDKKMIQALE
jgi:hypothetical protein